MNMHACNTVNHLPWIPSGFRWRFGNADETGTQKVGDRGTGILFSESQSPLHWTVGTSLDGFGREIHSWADAEEHPSIGKRTGRGLSSTALSSGLLGAFVLHSPEHSLPFFVV